MTAPFGRRLCEVGENRASGGYRVFSLLDREGPEPLPGQFYMLAAADRWAGSGERPFLPRAISVAETGPAAEGNRLDFLVEGVGPGTDRLCALGAGEGVWVMRRRFAERNVPTRVLLGFRDRAHSGGLDDLFTCCEVRLASEDGHAGHRGYVTDLLAALLEGDAVASAAVYACGPPAMLETVRALCAERRVACGLAMESPMACGYGACFGCAVPRSDGGFMRLCVDGPVVQGEQIAEVTHA